MLHATRENNDFRSMSEFVIIASSRLKNKSPALVKNYCYLYCINTIT